MKKNTFIFITLSLLCLMSCNHSKKINPIQNQKVMITKDITYIPEGVCSQQMDISVVNDTIRYVKIYKGCSGNTQGVSRLVEGMQIDDAITKLEGIICGDKTTSCPDQLSKALKSMK